MAKRDAFPPRDQSDFEETLSRLESTYDTFCNANLDDESFYICHTQCHRYRLGFDQIGRNRMREKVTASFLFKTRKESYSRSVAHPFQGDYVRLRQNTQWRKLVNETPDHYIVFADIVSKITRSSGRVTSVILFSFSQIQLTNNLHILSKVGSGAVCRVDQFHDDFGPADLEYQVPRSSV